MNAAKLLELRFIVVYFFLFYLWIFAFLENEWTRVLGTNLFSIIGSAISFIWLFRTYKAIKDSSRYFWLLLSAGAMFYIAGSGISFYYQTLLSIPLSYPSEADIMWLGAYFLFLAAFFYRSILMVNFTFIQPFLFNIVLFMIIAATFSLQYVIEPVFKASDYSLASTVVTLAYPVFDLIFLFMAVSFYYLSQSQDQRVFSFIMLTGFLIQIAGDSLYIYLSFNKESIVGNFIDPIWQVPLLLKGLAGTYTQKYLKEMQGPASFYTVSSYSVFPYISVLFLLLFIFYQYYIRFNFLIFGCALAVVLIIIRQLSVMKKNENLMKEYKYLALHDPLTGLSNRAKFTEDIKKIYNRKNKMENKAALLLIDLDRFKGINDTLGHQAGDSLLKEFSEKVQNGIKDYGTVYRMGGDEFLVMLPNIPSESYVLAAAKKIMESVQEPFFIDGNELVVTPSIGISLFPEHGETPERLFKNADAAMYLAKAKGKNNFQLFNTSLHDVLVRKMDIETGLRKALREKQFTLCYQPRINLQTGSITGMEALLRWKHPSLGNISPEEFIPVAEETGEIIWIGEWVLKKACEQTKKWHDQGFSFLHVSVNVSVRQLQQTNFIQRVRDILKETRLDARFLEIEITESIIQNLNESAKLLNDLQSLGIRTAIDDFGTGYSSLHVLTKLPLDVIKLDKSFIDDLDAPANRAILKAIGEMGSCLNLHVVAEGIEQERQANILLSHHCLYGQGYLFGKPAEETEFEKFLSLSQEIN